MRRNVGRADQIARIIVGIGLFVLPSLMTVSAWGASGLYLVGGILIVTALFGFCPIYAALGLGSRRRVKP